MRNSDTEGQPDMFRNADEDTTGHGVRAFNGPNADDNGAAEGKAARDKDQDDDTEGHRIQL